MSHLSKGKSGFTAEEIVGWNDPGNKNLFPDKDFARAYLYPLRCFGPDADPLVACLATPVVQSAVAQYQSWDDTAGTAQTSYKKWSQWIPIPTVFGLALCGLLALFLPSTYAAWLSGVFGDRILIEARIRLYVPLIIYALLLTTLMLAWRYNPNVHHKVWHEHRGDAEAMRREIFTRLMAQQPAGIAKADPWLLQLKLEYFRRWQVEVQHAYFGKRPKEHRALLARAKRFYWGYIVALLGLGLLLLCSVVTGLDEQGYNPIMSPIGSYMVHLSTLEVMQADHLMGVLFAIAAVAAAHFYIATKHTKPLQNAVRFENMEKNFAEIVGPRLALAREAAARGDVAGVENYVNRVNGMMSIETNDWVRLQRLDVGKDQADYTASGPAV